jgi:hypothetical protein
VGSIAGVKRCYLKSSTLGARTGSPQTSGFFCKDKQTDTSLVAGTMGYVAFVPKGTAMRFVLSALAGQGITAAVSKWGEGLRAAYALHRVPRGASNDPVGRSLGYW